MKLILASIALVVFASPLAFADRVHCHVYRYDERTGEKLTCGDADLDSSIPESAGAQFSTCSADVGIFTFGDQAEIWVRHLKRSLFEPMSKWVPDRIGALSYRPGMLMDEFAVSCMVSNRYDFIADCQKQ